MADIATLRPRNVAKQEPATRTDRLQVHEWRTQRACGHRWGCGGGVHLDGSGASAAILIVVQ